MRTGRKTKARGDGVPVLPMLSEKARYGLRALVELARAGGGQVTSDELALRADAPHKFLEAILLELARKHAVVSTRGKVGG
jgi:DNA-binding IscR family transcriptional regulator